MPGLVLKICSQTFISIVKVKTNLSILMDFPIHIETISVRLPIVYFKGNFLNYDIFLPLKVVLIISNSVDPDEMQHNAAFYLGRYCLLKYSLRGFQFTKD